MEVRLLRKSVCSVEDWKVELDINEADGDQSVSNAVSLYPVSQFYRLSFLSLSCQSNHFLSQGRNRKRPRFRVM